MADRKPEKVSEVAVLGCGTVGSLVVQTLSEKEDKDLFIVDNDETRVEAMREQDLNAIKGDIREMEIAEMVSHIPVVLILTSDDETNKIALDNLRSLSDEQFIVVRAVDPVSQEELAESNPNEIINPPQVIADSALRLLETGELEVRVQRLLDIIKREGEFAVVIYKRMEPDPIAAAVALKVIAEQVEVDADIVQIGGGSPAKVRAFINLLGMDIETKEDLGGYDTIAVVSHVEDFEELGFDVDIYIDHHEAEGEVPAEFSDVRTNLGSNSTILTKYIQEMGITGPKEMLTGLLHGIRKETLYFRRNTGPADLTAAAYLYPYVEQEILESLESPTMSPNEIDVLAESIMNRKVEGAYLWSNVGFINNKETLSSAVENLLTLEGVNTAVVFGVTDDEVYISARSGDVRVNIADVLIEALGESATVDGHAVEANASMPLGLFGSVEGDEQGREMLLELVDEAITKKILDSMGIEAEETQRDKEDEEDEDEEAPD